MQLPYSISFFRESMRGATDFWDFLDFRCLFHFLPARKASDFAGFPFFRCLFHFLPARKASDFRDFLDFRCLFHFLPPIKATNFAEFPFFRCLFPLHKPRKATNFTGFPFFRCLLATILTQEIFNSSFLFSHTINGLMHFLKKLVVAQVSIRHFAEPHQYEIVTYFLYKPARFVLRIPESPNLLPPLKYH